MLDCQQLTPRDLKKCRASLSLNKILSKNRLNRNLVIIYKAPIFILSIHFPFREKFFLNNLFQLNHILSIEDKKNINYYSSSNKNFLIAHTSTYICSHYSRKTTTSRNTPASYIILNIRSPPNCMFCIVLTRKFFGRTNVKPVNGPQQIKHIINPIVSGFYRRRITI